MTTLPRMTKLHAMVSATVLLSLLLSACAAATSETTDGQTDDTASSPDENTAEQQTEAEEGGSESQPTETEEEVEIELATSIVWESYNYGTAGLGGEGTQQLIDEFEALHPGITVEPIGTSAGEIHTSVQAAAAAGNPPDVAQIGWSKWPFVLETCRGSRSRTSPRHARRTRSTWRV